MSLSQVYGPATRERPHWDTTIRHAPDLIRRVLAHRRANHPDQPIMTYEEFFVERQEARYAIGKGRFRGCC